MGTNYFRGVGRRLITKLTVSDADAQTPARYVGSLEHVLRNVLFFSPLAENNICFCCV